MVPFLFPSIGGPSSPHSPPQLSIQDPAMTATLLTGRGPDVSSEIREKFVQLSQEHGIVKENILDLTKTGKFSLLFLLQMIMEQRRNPRKWS